MISSNPYTQNHTLRVAGSVLCIGSIIICNFVLVYWQSSDVTIGSRWGMFFISPVKSWRTWWYSGQACVCEIAQDATAAGKYPWSDEFLSAFSDVDLSALCSTFFTLMTIGLLACCATIACSLAVLLLTLVSRLKGDPEIHSHDYYSHCESAIIFVAVCVFLIAVSSIVFLVTLKTADFGTKEVLTFREGSIVTILSSLWLGLVVFAYQRDRALLATKFEFEKLEWKPADDARDEYRKRMQTNMAALEAAKYGGLQSPYEMARQADKAMEGLSGLDKYMLTKTTVWT